MNILLYLITFLFAVSNAQAVSFNCAKASSFVEKAICNDSLLGKLDDTLSENYNGTMAVNIGDGAKKKLLSTQRSWLSERNKCTDNKCLENAYRSRIDEVCDYDNAITGAAAPCTLSEEIK